MVGITIRIVRKLSDEDIDIIKERVKDIFDVMDNAIEVDEAMKRKVKVGKILVEDITVEIMDILQKKIKEELSEIDKVKVNMNRHNTPTCNSCGMLFKNISDLEGHLKVHHGAKHTFACEICDNKFETKWRLRKHRLIHKDKGRKQCLYFKHKVTCPFENLGCKFLHESFDISKIEHVNHVENQEDTKNTTLANPNDEREEITESGSFFISTPKKFDQKCTNCFQKSKYCMVCEILEKEESSSVKFFRRINFNEVIKKEERRLAT